MTDYMDILIMNMHEKSMSDNAEQAIYGRLGKQLFPMMFELVEAERNRGSCPSDTVLILQAVFAKAYAGAMMQSIDLNAFDEFPMKECLDSWRSALKHELEATRAITKRFREARDGPIQ